MATSYPYVSAQGALVKAFDQFRKSFPATIDAATLKKFSIAPANESYVINTFRFLGLIDDDGKKIDGIVDFFFGGDPVFQSGLEQLLLVAYAPLFADHGEAAWDEPQTRLATWFRVTDKTSDLVGGRQATTFKTLAALAGHGEIKQPIAKPAPSSSTKSANAKSTKTAAAKPPATPGDKRLAPEVTPVYDSVGLTVRIEVNLPATGTAEVYDSIFASIRRHLIDRD